MPLHVAGHAILVQVGDLCREVYHDGCSIWADLIKARH
jgi:hypothetical protein